MDQPMNASKLPQTDSIQELARFWDTHDLTDFPEELEEVSGLVFERETSIEVRLKPQEADILKHLAQSKGVDFEDLIHQWVVEKIQTS
jgi:predicted phosphatase